MLRQLSGKDKYHTFSIECCNCPKTDYVQVQYHEEAKRYFETSHGWRLTENGWLCNECQSEKTE